MTKNEYKKGVLQCRSCRNIFHQSDVNKVETERLGQKVIEGACPNCGSHTYGLVDYPVDEFDLQYKNFYHRNTDKKLRKELNKTTNEIITKDIKI